MTYIFVNSLLIGNVLPSFEVCPAPFLGEYEEYEMHYVYGTFLIPCLSVAFLGMEGVGTQQIPNFLHFSSHSQSIY